MVPLPKLQPYRTNNIQRPNSTTHVLVVPSKSHGTDDDNVTYYRLPRYTFTQPLPSQLDPVIVPIRCVASS